jgi:hypothetical protein
MNKILVLAAALLAANAVAVVKADETFLVVPPQMYTDGNNYSEFIRYFKAESWQVQTSWEQCQSYARWMHTSRISAPHYSACVDGSELSSLRSW